jgi:hypothetical protein
MPNKPQAKLYAPPYQPGHCLNHPDRLIFCQDLCKICYKKVLDERKGPARCHPSRKAYNKARGLCKPCYESWRKGINKKKREYEKEYKKQGPKKDEMRYADKCIHDWRPHFGLGYCFACYQQVLLQKKKIEKMEGYPGLVQDFALVVNSKELEAHEQIQVEYTVNYNTRLKNFLRDNDLDSIWNEAQIHYLEKDASDWWLNRESKGQGKDW